LTPIDSLFRAMCEAAASDLQRPAVSNLIREGKTFQIPSKAVDKAGFEA
jgi:hypothetical protein